MSNNAFLFDAHLLSAIMTLQQSEQRVTVSYTLPNGYTSRRIGRIKDIDGSNLRIKTHSGMYWHHYVPLDQIVSIVSTNKNRSKRDLAKYGEYRVYYRKAEVALTESGELDMANTLRRMLAVA